MTLDLNDAQPQRDGFDLIPAGTILKLHGQIRPGQAGEGGWLTPTKAGDGEYINWEFTVLSAGQFANRKVWQNMTTSGTGKVNEKGELVAWNITKGTLRAMLNSARGFKADDDSEAARKARVINGWHDLDQIEFVGRIGIEPEKGGYPAKNKLAAVIEPGHKDYEAVMRGESVAASAAAPSAAPRAPAPAWATSASQPQANSQASAPQQPKQEQPAAASSGLPAWAR